MIDALWDFLDRAQLKPDDVQARYFTSEELIDIYKEFLVQESKQDLTRDDILTMEKSVFQEPTKLLTYYLVISMESSDYL